MKQERLEGRESSKASATVGQGLRGGKTVMGKRCLHKRKNNGDGNERIETEDIKDIESTGLSDLKKMWEVGQ